MCEFLGVEEPGDRSFPHLNTTADFRRAVRRRYALPFGALGVGALLLAGLALLRLAGSGRPWGRLQRISEGHPGARGGEGIR